MYQTSLNKLTTVGQNFSTRLAFQNHFEIRSQDSAPTRWGLDLWDILAINLLFFTSFSVHVLSFPSLGWFLLPPRQEEARLHKCRHNRSCKTRLLILILQRFHTSQIRRARSQCRGAGSRVQAQCFIAGSEQALDYSSQLHGGALRERMVV